MTDRLRVLWSRIMEMARTPMPDAVSHVLHWILVITLTSVIAALGGHLGWNPYLTGYVASELILYGFCLWEGFNYGTHRALGHDMRRWTRDGLLDLVGPVANRIIWTLVYLL